MVSTGLASDPHYPRAYEGIIPSAVHVPQSQHGFRVSDAAYIPTT